MPEAVVSNFRIDAIQQVDEFLVEKVGFERLESHQVPERKDPPNDPNVAGWRGEIDCEGTWYSVIVAVKSSFPDTIPRVYSSEPPPFTIPHITVSRDNYICALRPEEFFLNTHNPVSIAIETLQAASSVLSDGFSGRNVSEFDNEFNAYWGMSAFEQWISIVPPQEGCNEVVYFDFKPPIGKSSVIFSNSSTDGKEWLRYCNREVVKGPYKALYFSLPAPLRPPFPATFQEAAGILNDANPKYIEHLHGLIAGNRHTRYSVLFSFRINGRHTVWGGWVHHFRVNKKRQLIKGFRNSRLPGRLKYQHCNKYPIAKTIIERFDMERIQLRVGNDNYDNISNKNIMVVGCGSIGGKIALSLGSCGIGKLTLIDHDVLSSENLARHICPCSEVGSNKAEATASIIKSKFPSITVEPFNSNFYRYMEKEKDKFESVDLVISATGDKNLNHRLNWILLNELQELQLTCLYTWIEAFGLGSHSILVVPGQGGCIDCMLDSDSEYQHRVVISKSSEVLRQEAGCNSTFLPFTGLDAELASNSAVRLTLSYFNNLTTYSARWVYIGELDYVDPTLARISSEYHDCGQNKLLKFTLRKDSTCRICGH